MFEDEYELEVEFQETDTEVDAEFDQGDNEVDAEFGKFQYIGVPGPKGLDALACTVDRSVECNVGDTDIPFTTGRFNRTPVVGDVFATLSGGGYYTIFKVYEILGKYAMCECTDKTLIKGDPGDNGDPGYTPVKNIDYFDGKDGRDGYTPVKNVDYFDGKDGKDGKDGYTPIKGIDYFDGIDGKNGADGYTPVKNKDYFDGKDGHTPVRGTDYYTEADKAEMVSAVISALPVYNGEVVDV